ncbi:hypothetical protein [Angelakisella massiliensis]|uniref:hypothetical protein n=1 Tax=Angelakisella massiliensis TaxID=1871018 RepID=UPI0024B0E3C6|nr:hypothetical protein [Angelakisella massiliensis]
MSILPDFSRKVQCAGGFAGIKTEMVEKVENGNLDLIFKAAESISAKRRNKLLQNRSDEKTPKELPQTLAFLPLISTFFCSRSYDRAPLLVSL